MAYATLDDLVTRFGADNIAALTTRDIGADPDTSVAATALDDASQMIDSYLAGRYQLPLNPVPQVVVRWCCDIARFLLSTDQASDAIKALYNAAVQALAAAQAGRLTLEAAAVDTPTTGGAVLIAGPARMFDANSLRGA